MHVVSVNVGSPRPHPAHPEHGYSGIFKEPVAAVVLSPTGVVGDHVLDRKHHGMPSKAVCVFSASHYPALAQLYPGGDWQAGSFGENLTVSELDEAQVHLGDIWRVGEAVVQVTQPRGPCATLAGRHGIRDFVRVCITRNTTGWYLRVLTPGVVQAGDGITLLEAHPAAVSVAEANATRYAAEPELAAVLRLLAVDALSDEWRRDLEPAWNNLQKIL